MSPNSAVHDLTWHEYRLLVLVDERVSRRALIRHTTDHGNQFLRAGEVPVIPFPAVSAIPVEVDDVDTYPMRVYDE